MTSRFWTASKSALVFALSSGGGGGPSGDVTPPTLTLPVGTQTGTATATIGATTNEANGTLYGVVSTSSTPPTAAQVKAGLVASGAAAVYAGSVAVSSTGAKTLSATGLTASTAYFSHLMHEDLAGNQSNVVSSSSFTTATGVTAATLSSPTAVAASSTTATLGVTTDTASGTLYWVASTSATPPTSTQILAGQDSSGSAAAASGNQAVSSTGAKTATATGLTAFTTYYAYFAQHTSVDSNVASAASFAGGLGPEIAVDGNLTAAAGVNWACENGTWTISAGVASAVNDNFDEIFQFNAGIVSGHTYRVKYTVNSVSAGAVNVYLSTGGNFGTNRTAPGTYSENITPTGGTGSIDFRGNVGSAGNFTGSISAISVREVLA